MCTEQHRIPPTYLYDVECKSVYITIAAVGISCTCNKRQWLRSVDQRKLVQCHATVALDVLGCEAGGVEQAEVLVRPQVPHGNGLVPDINVSIDDMCTYVRHTTGKLR